MKQKYLSEDLEKQEKKDFLRVSQDSLTQKKREYDLFFCRSVAQQFVQFQNSQFQKQEKQFQPEINFTVRQDLQRKDKLTLDLEIKIEEGKLEVISDELILGESSNPKSNSLKDEQLLSLQGGGAVQENKVQFLSLGGCLCKLEHTIQKELTRESKKQLKVSQYLDETQRGIFSCIEIEIPKTKIKVIYLFQVVKLKEFQDEEKSQKVFLRGSDQKEKEFFENLKGNERVALLEEEYYSFQQDQNQVPQEIEQELEQKEQQEEQLLEQEQQKEIFVQGEKEKEENQFIFLAEEIKRPPASRKITEEDLNSQTTAITDLEFATKQRKLSDALGRSRKNSSNSNSSQKGDKKNVVKNFVKAFRGFLCQWGDEEILMEKLEINEKKKLEKARIEWTQFESQNKYNNKLVKELLTQSKWSPLFVYFLQNKALEWLQNSGVVDKKSHLDVLQGYLKASIDHEELNKIVCLRSRNHEE